MSEQEKNDLENNENTELTNQTQQENSEQSSTEKSAESEHEKVAEKQTESTEEKVTEIAEVESDEHTDVDEFAHEVNELPDYAHMKKPQLVEEAKKLVARNDPKGIKEEMEALHEAAIHIFEEERAEKLHEFLENGGESIDFVWDQPLKKEIQDAYREYKHQRHEYYKKLERELEENLVVKRGIIDAIRELPNKEGSVPEKYKVFRDYQDRWKNTGPVPRAESNELWKNYHHHVDNFYDFLRISNELRELDFKKNLDKKEALCAEAEALAQKEIDRDTFKALQDLHAKWKQVGPVDREHREPMWERFSAATKIIHDKRHEYFSNLREKRQDLIEHKKEIIEKMLAQKLDDLKTHGAWQNVIKEMNAMRDEFKKIGRINLPENDELWNKFREVNQVFNRKKNAFYKSLKAKHQENLERKKELLAKAEELKDSTDWKNTASQLKRIQSEWKKIGYVPKSESDKIWKAFRDACNHFFNQLTEHNKELDKKFEANLDTKKEILEALKVWKAPAGNKESMAELKAFINKWKAAGRVPRNAKEIENEFNSLLDQHFKALKINKKESALLRFENKVHNLAEGNSRQLDREESHLQRQIDEAEKELRQLENNFQFFAHADENSPIVKNAKKNITRQKEQIELLKEKLSMLKNISND